MRNTGYGLSRSEAQLGNLDFSDSFDPEKKSRMNSPRVPLHSHLLTGKTYFIAAASLFRWNQRLTTGFVTEECFNYKVAMLSIFIREYFKH